MKIEFDTTKLKKQVEENPLLAAGIFAGVLTGASKLMNANTQRKNSKTWKKEVERRNRATK
jgi:hypothetical protein